MPVPPTPSNSSACTTTPVRTTPWTATRPMATETVALGVRVPEPRSLVALVVVVVVPPHARLALPAAPSTTKTPMRISTVAGNAMAAPATHGHVNAASPATRIVGASSSPCMNATCATTSTGFNSEDVAVHSNAKRASTDISPAPPPRSPRSGIPSVPNMLTVPLISRRNARSAKDHAMRSVVVTLVAFAAAVVALNMIPRLASTYPNMSTRMFCTTSCTPGTGVYTNSRMAPEMTITGSVSSSSTTHRCSPRSSATASDELGVVHTNRPVTT
mmetsp:Transcript_6356/g.16170  ORF Transcript_6356/g.16170 Transcript_6356/m.16170 type:complete len:273 (+) Transcript_6356:729-1547(+)